MSTTVGEQTVLPPDDDDGLAGLTRVLAVSSSGDHASLVGPDGTTVALPEPVYRVLQGVVAAMAQGLAITVAPHNTLLTTQEAADLLGMSRPTLIKIAESGELPFILRGRHRRIQLTDALDYQDRMRVQRRDTLTKMMRDSEESGGYEATSGPPPVNR
ncbi:MAG TPA: helix-turn-helix domain-containing protein [Pseudonocardiaceae bacterium]|jgi:excisionase family DNA binding protein|nr:helix-turn-helix domain-containing protein [Pseudonocardiaceae bacterium]